MGKDGDPGGQPASSKDPKLQAIKVRLLDGTSRDFELPRGSSGDALFALVSNLLNLSIEEREYFSLCFYDTEGTRHWLYNDKKILRQLKGLPWEFCFEVKFYPTIPSSLNDDHARYNLFLQLKHDVSTGRLPATIETHAILGSLVAQAEFGDAKPTAEYEQYLRTTKFAPQNSDQLIEMIAQKHKEHKGLTPAEAENLYMDTCKQQTMYGIFVFNAKDNKNVPVGIGVCAHGIYIYKEQIRVNRFPWQGIIKICYRKAQFAIKLKAGEIDKKEATVTYKVADYEHAKRIWKCAVEHHTFFRLIQPDEKPKSSLFRWGSARFRYQGRTQFQTKMASQMFDKPHQTAVQRFDSARLTHSLDNVAREQAPSGHVSPLHYADNELGAREPMASPAVSYEVSGQNEKRKLDDKVGNGLPSDDDELVYTPVESPSSAAYYLSERSSACSPNSNDFVFSQQMRSATTPYSWRTNDRDQSSSAASGGVYYPCTESVKGSRSLPQQASTSTHSAIDSIEKRAEMEQRPINDSVHVYHPGNYQNLRHQPRPVNLFSNDVNNQRNGVTAVRRLGPDNEMDRHPIRYFVDVQHSGASQIPRVSRVRHPGKEEIGPAVLSNYSFSKSPDTSVPVQRLEPQRDVTCHNIRQYSSVYHPGSSQISASKSLEDDSPTVRLVARVQPASLPQERSQPSSLPRERSQPASDNNGALEVSSRLEEPYDAKRNGESSSGILKFWKIKDRKHGEKNKRHSKTENESEQNGESKAFIGQTAVITTGTRPIEERERQEKAAVTSHPSTSNGSQLREENGSERAYTSTTEIAHRRWRHEDDEETVEKDQVRPETYGVASTSYAGPLESTARQSELQSAPLRDYAQAYHHGQSWDAGKGVKTPTSESEHTAGKKAVLHLRTSPVKEKPSPTAQEEEARRIRLIARVPHSTSEEEPDSSKPRKEQDSSGLFGFWKTGKGKQRGGSADESAYPTSAKYAGPLDDVNRQRDIDEIPFKAPAAVAYKPSADVPESAHHRVHLFGRWRHEGDEETVEKDQVRPETYGVASTSYAGPLESTARQSELQSAPLRDYAQAYHHGQSWDAGKGVKTPTSESEHTAGKKAVLHLRTSPVKEKPSPTAQEEEARRIRLIARVPHSTSEEEPDSSKPRKEQDSSGLFGFWKTGKGKQRGGPADESAYPTSAKYAGPLDDVNRQRDIDEIPFKAPAAVAYKPSADVPESAHHRVHLFGRWRHEGDEETVEKDQVRPETYGVASTSYAGPLESTARQSELQSAPLRDYAQAYHHGQSWDAGKGVKTPTSESEHTAGKKAVLHLRTSPVKEKPSPTAQEEEARRIRLIARVPHSTSEEEPDSSKPRKEQDSSGLFGFWKTGKGKQRGGPADESAYPTSAKYAGPLDDVNRQRDIDEIPFKAPAAVAYKPSADVSESAHHRVHLFGRWRHEGDEETVEKDQVRPETYGVASTSYAGPLESTARQSELQSAPLRDYAQAYHHGQSWDAGKGVKTPTSESEHTAGKKAVLHLRTSPVKEKPSPTAQEEEARRIRLIARVPHSTSEEEPDSSEPRKEQDSSGLFGFWKTGKGKQRGGPADESAYPTSAKYAGPLDDVNRQRDIDEIPFKAPAAVAYKPSADVPESAHHRVHLFGRWRHEGDEETVEKDQVRPETYGVASTSYAGPLESTARQSELQSAPLRDYAQAYHHGQSWDAGKGVKTPTTHVSESEHTAGKKAVLHLRTSPVKEKPSPTAQEEEARRIRLIARVPHSTSEEEPDSSKPRKEQDSSGLFGFWKTGKGKQRGGPADESAYPTSAKYAGPLDDVNRQRDIDEIPFKAPAAVAYKPSADVPESAHHRVHLFGRWRHEGDEETVEKDQVRPETYGVASTSYAGPLESTARQSELQSAPLRDYAQAYHHGQSWDAGKGVKTPTTHVSESEHTAGKKAVLHLRTSPVKEKPSPTAQEEEARRIRLIARVPHSTSEEEPDSSKPRKEQDSSGLFGFWKTGKGKQRGGPADESAYPTSAKYAGPLDDVNRQRDIDEIPFKAPAAVAYKPSADVPESAHHRVHLFGRWRHEGDEETVEKDQVRPETYGVASTSYAGPLESTARQSELQSAPLRDYAQAYHHGQSWDAGKGVKTPTTHVSESEHTAGKKAVLHLRTSPVKEKPSPTAQEEEARRIRLIARVPHSTSEEEPDSSKPRKEQDSSGLFGFWKTGKGKQRGGPADESAYPTSAKYAGPLDDVNRQRDIDEIPFKAPAAVAYKPSADVPESAHHRVHLFGRWRHEGDEETVEKDQVRPETYGVASTSYAGPLESTARQSELQSAPLRDYAQAYHHGQSWDAGKGVKTPTTHVSESEHTAGKKAVLHLRTSPVKEKPSPTAQEEEARRIRLIARVPHSTSEEEPDSSKPRKEQDSSGLFGFWKTGKGKQRGGPADESAYPTSAKYAGPLDDVNRQRDIDEIPFKAPAAVAYKPSADVPESAHHRVHLFGRWRHEGDEETVEKDQVRPETYGVASTSYAGPLESTARQSELQSAPLRDYAQAYHHGQSWDAGKGVKTPTTHVSESEHTAGKKAVLHLRTSPVKEKPSPTAQEEEARRIRLIARVPHSTSEEEPDSSKPRKEQDSSGLFGFWKTGKGKQRGGPADESAYPTSAKYAGPLDDVNRQRDIDEIPFKAPAAVAYKPSADVPESAHHRVHLFGRWRHEGDEETVEKDQVRPETYGVASTSYAGPLESTARQSELQSAPLRDYAQAYHHGQSWDAGKGVKTPTTHVSESEHTAGKKAVLHLRTSPVKEKPSPTAQEEEARRIRLIARVPHSTSEEEPDSSKPRKEQDSSGLFGFWKTGKGKQRGGPADESAYPTSAKYAGPLDDVNRQRDIDEIPFKAPAAVAYKPSADVPESAHHRVHLFGRWRHEGDEETVEKDQVRPETYGVASTSYAGPLESTARQSELQSAPLRDYAQAYHHGQSWDAGKGVKTPTTHVSESEHTAGKKAVLHLRTSPVKEKPSPTAQEEEARRIRLIARVPHSTSEEEPDSSKPRKEQDSSGLFGFWKTGKGKQRGGPADESAYPTSAKYAGPLDDVNRQRDIDEIPFKAPAAVAYKPSADVPESAHHRVHLFGRWRHEGDEETVEKDQVRPETYGVASTSYAGPLESTARQSELQSAPLRDYAQAYHHGQSWDAGKGVKTPTTHVSESEHTAGKKAVLHLRTSPVKEKPSPTAQEEEARRIRLIARVPHSTSEEEPDSSKPRKEQDSSGLFGFWKTGKGKQRGGPADESAYPTSAKYAGPLDDVNRQRDIDEIPFKAPAAVAYKPSADVPESAHHRVHLFGRWRHEGDEETVEKDQVRPETYGVASTSYAGPLESTARQSELQSAPLRDYAQAYHHGQSWDAGKGVKTPTTHVSESEHTAGKKAVLHLRTSPVKEKPSPTAQEEEARRIRLIARVPHSTSEEEPDSSKPRKEQDSSGLFGFWKTGKGKQRGGPADESAYPTSAKYAGPLDDVNRQRDIDEIPFKAPAAVAYKPSADVPESAHHRVHLFGRWRHEGDEETVEKDQVRPETYGVASTSYAGPLESTARQSELQSAPLRDYAQAYHHGQSWDAGKGVKTPTTHVSESEHTAGKKAVLHLRTSPVKEKPSPTAQEEEARRIRLIARVPHSTSEKEPDSSKPRKEQDSSGLFGFWKTGKGKQRGGPADESAYPTSAKYAGPLDDVNRQRDIDEIPFKAPAAVAYKPSADVPESAHHRVHLFGRWRHEGDEETVEKDQVRPETYGVASTSYAGPLESTARQSELQSAPLREYAQAYHHGQSWDAGKDVKTPTSESEHTAGKKAVLHLRTSPVKEKHSPTAQEEEARRIRLIARVPHSTSEEEPDLSKSGKEIEKQMSSGGRKTFIAAENYGITRTGPISVKSLQSDEVDEEMGGGSACSKLWSGTHPHSDVTTSKTKSTSSSLMEPLTGHSAIDRDRPITLSNRHVGRLERTTMSGEEYVEVRVDRRVEIQLEPAFCLTGAGLSAVSEDEDGLIFSVTPPPMPSSDRSFFSRLLFKGSSKKSKKQKKGTKETDSSDSSGSSDDEKNQVHIVPVESGGVTLPLYKDPEDKDGKLVRRETNELKYHLKGEGISPGFDPQNPSLASTMAEAERLNLRSPRLEHAERTVTVRALAPLPLSYEESGQPHTTISTWQESSRLPDEVTTEYDEKGNKITRTLKTSQVKHTVQKQTFQNYVVPTDGQAGVVTVERVREETTPLGTIALATNGSAGSPHVVETHSRSVAYEADPNEAQHEGLGEFVSCKTLTSGNRTVETYTYKTERDGIIETHVEHRVTIHSDEPIDHDAELSQAIMEATQMNPDMTVEKIEVRQESTA